tara:strand:- start:51 stop:239 length:189 start_codon:yes stop_codon:yes gene_type:complete
MNITSAYMEQMNGIDDQIVAEIDGLKVYIPLNAGNRYYREVMDQVEAGTLVMGDTVNIEEAD